jgi:ribosomal protein S18 acetylase RimI-like enzyme
MRRAVGATLVLVLNRVPNAHPTHLEEWPPRDTHAAARAHMNTRVEQIREFVGTDCEDLCQATEEAIIDGLGFDWLQPPGRPALESYWRGVLLVPERELFVARLEQAIVGTAQLVKPSRSNEAAAFNAVLTTFFVTPWARGHGLARRLLAEVETWARRHGFKQISLDVRATQDAAIALYESKGYVRWGVKPKYALANRKFVPGYYYAKALAPPPKSSKRTKNPAGAATGT